MVRMGQQMKKSELPLNLLMQLNSLIDFHMWVRTFIFWNFHCSAFATILISNFTIRRLLQHQEPGKVNCLWLMSTPSWRTKTSLLISNNYSTGRIIDSAKILAWSFSDSNFSIGDALVTENLPSFVHHKKWFPGAQAFAVGVTSIVFVLIISCGYVAFFVLRRRKTQEEVEDWELE